MPQAEVIAIIQLYDCLLTTICSLPAADQQRLALAVNINLAHVRFEGFDRADITKERHYLILQDWIEEGLYPDYKYRCLHTANANTLPGYRAMLAIWLPAAPTNTLTWEQLIELLRLHCKYSDNQWLMPKKSTYDRLSFEKV